MHIYRLAVCLFLLLFAGCGGGGASSAAEPVGTIFVDSVNGNDLSGDGSINLPFQTITHAVANRRGISRIKLASGRYDAASGEVFPIVIPAGVTISSNTIDLATNSYALISGAGSYTSQNLSLTNQVALVLGNSATVQSVVVEGVAGVGVWSEDGAAVIESSVIQNSNTGVVSAGSSKLMIDRSIIKNNLNVGLDTLNNALPIIKQSKFTGNGIGILVSGSAKPSFIENSNELLANTFCDLRHLGSAAIEAQGVLWDNDQFSFSVVSNCVGGANISNEGTGSVSFQYIPPVGIPVFTGTQRLILNAPSRGALLSTDQPDFSWIPSGSTITMMAIWDRPPSFVNGQLSDQSRIQWIWHSGLGTGVPGFVTFSDGRSVLSGDINNLAAPIPLQRGKSYYWAVWEWDASALTIHASSELGYFTVLN